MTTNRLQCHLEFKVNGRRSHKTVKIVNFLDQVCIIILEFSAIRPVPNNPKFQALPKGNIAVIQLGRCTIPNMYFIFKSLINPNDLGMWI